MSRSSGETRVVLEGLGFPESTRWRDGRVWLCNWGSGEVLTAGTDGTSEVVARIDPHALPFSIDWLPDGRLLVVDGPRRLLLCRQPDGALEVFSDLTGFGPKPFNELVVDSSGNAYVNGGPGLVVCVRPDGNAREVADGLQWPNGMAILDDGHTLVVADSHARQLAAFDVEFDGALSRRRVWPRSSTPPTGSVPIQTGRSGLQLSLGNDASGCAREARCWAR